MLYVILLECDPKASLGGSTFRDQLNIYKHLPPKTNTTTYCLNTNTLNINLKSKFTSEKNKRKSNTNILTFHNSLDIFQIWKQIIKNIKPDDSVIFLLTGHGYQIRDLNGDELGGYDSYVYLSHNTKLLDDTIKTMIDRLPPKVRFIGLADTCHSGTMFDLPQIKDKPTLNSLSPSSHNPTLPQPNHYSLSACTDKQLDSCDIGNVAGYGGSLTVHLLEQPNSLEQLIFGSEEDIKNIHKKLIPILNKLNQTPILGHSDHLTRGEITNIVNNSPTTHNSHHISLISSFAFGIIVGISICKNMKKKTKFN